ncbi:oligosaccharide repeat unit polymerase [Enterobacter sp. HN503E2II]|uniref:O-antigen polymerase n=1 Tax=Enterobacter sp. HN503E2II TaxID=2041079 RepID=UPI000D57E855|nr:O-antigen polymerase [Enterobacter sp. HN503E2II]PVU51588.1 oligosaccharide repeat unit polymerase [Enterobacter sp. HN503E2II]
MIYVLLLAIISSLGIFVALYFIKTNLTSPLSLHCFAWFLVSIVGLFAYDDFNEFSEISFYAFIIWYSILYFILMIGELVVLTTDSRSLFINKRYVCSRYWIVVLPLSLYSVWEIYNVGKGGPASFFLNLRLANIIDDYDGVKFTLLTAVYPVMVAIFAIVCLADTTKKNKYSILLWILLCCIGTMGKFAIVTPILIYLIIREMTVGLNKRKLFLLAPIITVTILLLHFIRMSSEDNATVSSVLGVYIYSPLLALSKLSELDSSGDSGIYTFRFIFAILYKLGLSSTEPVKTIMEYVNVPVPTNVFTVMQPFFQDYSLYGVAFGAMFYEVIYASVYICARQDSPVAMLIYAVLAVGLFTSFFAETLITNFSGNMKLIICIYILWRFTVKCKINE